MTRSNAAMARWDEVKAEIHALLIQVARNRELITYSEITAELQTATLHYHSHIFARLLNEACYDEDDAERPLLGAVVVTKQTGMPSGGFFRIAAERGYDVSDPEAFWRSELARLYDEWSKH
jgi:hypothetical protein